MNLKPENECIMKWEMVKLGEAALNLDSKRKPLNESERDKISHQGLYPYIGANNVMGYVDEFLFDGEILCIAEDGGSWGKNEKCASVYKEKCWVNNHAHVLSFNGKSELKFLMYYLNYSDLNKFITGTTRGKLTKTALESIFIPLPPLPTQRAIAARLDRADALRQKDRQLLRAYDDLAQSVFVEMFEERPFSIDDGRNLVKIKGGYAFKSEDYSDYGIPLIRIGTINKGYFDQESLVYLSPKFKEDYSNFLLHPGDLLITLTGTIGKDDYGNVFILNGLYPEYLLNQRVAKLEIDAKLTKEYLFYFFKQQSVKRELTDISRGVRQANLSNEDIYKLNIPIPPLSLQNRFISILTNIEQQKEIVRKQQAESEALFGRLLQEAFGG